MMNYSNYAPSPFNIINQQYMTGCNFGQQGIYAEQIGNLWAAMQSYDQAIAYIQQSIAFAQQSGIHIIGKVYYDLAQAHFSNARVKNLLGYSEMSWYHCNQAQFTLNQALAADPYLASSIPNVLQMPYTTQTTGSNNTGQTNTIEALNTFFKMLDSAFKAANSFQGLWS